MNLRGYAIQGIPGTQPMIPQGAAGNRVYVP